MLNIDNSQLQEYLAAQPEINQYLGVDQLYIKSISDITIERHSPKLRLEFQNTTKRLIMTEMQQQLDMPIYIQLLNYLQEQGIPASRVIHCCFESQILGNQFMLLENEGINLDFQTFLRLNHLDRKSILEQVLMTVEKLQGLPQQYQVPMSQNNDCQKWMHQYKLHEVKKSTIIESLGLWFNLNKQDTTHNVICHGSLSLDKFIIDPNTMRVVGIDGFENIHIGNPTEDIANFFSFLFINPNTLNLSGMKGLEKQVGCDIEEGLKKLNIKTDQLKIQVSQGLFINAIDNYINKQYAAVEELSNSAWQLILDVTNNDPFNIRDRVNQDQVLWGNWQVSDRAKYYYYKVKDFMNNHLYPIEMELQKQCFERQGEERYHHLDKLEQLQDKVREEGLLNLCVSDPYYGKGFTQLEFSFMSELIGHSHFGHELFNSMAPDSGNVKLLIGYGTPFQKEKYLAPLFDARCKSYFAMTEREVSSSDPTNFQTTITPVEGGYVINGRKWYVSSIANDRCSFGIVMGKAPGDDPKNRTKQSLILIDHPHPQVKVLKTAHIVGFDFPPFGLMEVVYDNAFVPKENLLGDYGQALRIIQSRLVGGRLQHTIRMVGMTQRCLTIMQDRAEDRVLFNKKMSKMETFQLQVARHSIKLQTCRLLCLNAAMQFDKFGSKDPQVLKSVSECKAYSMRTCFKIIDDAIQKFGAEGASFEQSLVFAFYNARCNRYMDGACELHLQQVAKFNQVQHLFNTQRQVVGYGLAKL